MEVSYSDSGFTFVLNNTIEEFIWPDILQINVYKRDLITTDQNVMEILIGDTVFTLTEDIPDFYGFTDKLEIALPAIPKDWYNTLVTTPFATNFRTIYIRP